MMFGSLTRGSLTRAVALAGFCALLAGCGSTGGTELSAADLGYSHADRATTPSSPADDPRLFPDGDSDTPPTTVDGGPHLECVPYAREHSNINIHGDAYTWWDKAAGLYARGTAPLLQSVMVLVNYAGRHHAHVAVVRRIVSPREIRIDHANWLNDGAVYVNDPVIDVSADNDWSQVKVWNIRSGSWGTRVYAVRGFIGPGPTNANPAVSLNVPVPDATYDDPIARQIAATAPDLDETGNR